MLEDVCRRRALAGLDRSIRELVDLPDGVKKKIDIYENIRIHKERLVVKGFKQI